MTIIAAALLVVLSQDDSAQRLFAEMRAPDWTVRRAAFEQLVRSPSAVPAQQAIPAVTELLERENAAIWAAFRNGPGASITYGESYGEYVADVAGYLITVVQPTDTRALRALARSPYHENGKFAAELASFGEPLVPIISDLAVSDIAVEKWYALGLSGEMLRLDKRGGTRVRVTADSRSRLKQVLGIGTRDANVTVRTIAVRNLGIAGYEDALPLLEALAASDAGAVKWGRRTAYPVREEAVKAIALIRGAVTDARVEGRGSRSTVLASGALVAVWLY